MLWTHNLKEITYNDNFVPEGAPAGLSFKGITLGAGVQWHEAYDVVKSNGRVTVGEISAGGSVLYIVTGRTNYIHLPLPGVYNAIQFTVVLASGSYIIVNPYRYSDLFWAIRGGGGGTFGVVVTAAYQTHDILPVSGAFLSAYFRTPQIAQDVITKYIKLQPNILDAGWGGYSSYPTSGFQMLYIGTNVSLADANATMTPFFDFVQKTVGNSKDSQASLTNFSSFYDWYASVFRSPVGQVGSTSELATRFFSRKMAEEQPEKVAEATLAVTGGIAFYFVAGGAVSQHNPDSAGINPTWGESLGPLFSSITWPEGTPTTKINRLRRGAAANLALLDPLASNSGTYINGASLYEKDFSTTFFGSHYSALKVIKRKYDPKHLFLVVKGVGSDDWDESLNCRLCRY
ncbi:hypothetical protein AX15_007921 [Amanita polypyramis BW_CC]|nr:hypothetical protein AX15_007921 [Amanita polypyramis BW_CC]